MGRWFVLSSDGVLSVYPDAESTQEQAVLSVDLGSVERIERSKGMDYYDFCIDLIGADATARMRPIDRGDMQAWLGVLQTQLSARAASGAAGGSAGGGAGGKIISTIMQGWLEKRGEKGKSATSSEYKRRWFVLCARQEQTSAEKVELHHYLNYFKSEEAAAEVADKGVIDLSEVEEVRKADEHAIEIVTRAGLWQLRAESAGQQEAWFAQLRGITAGSHAGDPSAHRSSSTPIQPSSDVTTTASARLMMQVPGGGGATGVEGRRLQAAERRRAAMDERRGVAVGRGRHRHQEGARRVAPRPARVEAARHYSAGAPVDPRGEQRERRRLAAAAASRAAAAAIPMRAVSRGDAVLQRWIELLEDVAPEKPVSEIRNGWLDKKGTDASGKVEWKVRFFVLLSTHELLYFESDRSPKCKGVIDLKTACGALPASRVARLQLRGAIAFEVVSPERTWVLCPDDEETIVIHAVEQRGAEFFACSWHSGRLSVLSHAPLCSQKMALIASSCRRKATAGSQR